MRAIAWLLRVFCYLFHAVVSLALLGLGTVAILSNSHHLKLEILPWQGSPLNAWLVGLGIFGLLSVLDWVVVATYAGGLILLGLLMSRRRIAPVDYFLASRATTWPVIGLALLASNMSSTALVHT